MTKIGFLPCGGEATRWNGTFKELLPVGENRWLCDYALDAFAEADCYEVAVLSSPQKAMLHAQHFRREKYKKFTFYYHFGKPPMLQSIVEALPLSLQYDYTLFAMPDTVIPNTSVYPAFPDTCWVNDFSLGLFQTYSPERFSTYHNGMLYNKLRPHRSPEYAGKPYTCWGTITWTKEVAETMMSFAKLLNVNGTISDPIDILLQPVVVLHGAATHLLTHYRDIQNWEAYLQFIQEEVL